MAEEKQIKKKIYCNRCRSDTWHSLYGSHESHKQDEEDGFYDDRKFLLWACNGCDEGTLEEIHTWGHAWYEPEISGDSKTYYYPRRAHADRTSKYFMKLPEKLKNIYREVMQAFNHDLRVLCASGLRSLVEGICEEKGITAWSIEDKIEGLKAHLPNAVVDNLHGFRFMGKKAVHNLEAPSRDDLRLAIDVVEDLLNFLYQLDYRAQLLGQKLGAGKGGTPPKP